MTLKNQIFYKLSEINNDFNQIIDKLQMNLISNINNFYNHGHGMLPMLSHFHLNEFLHEIFNLHS